MTEQEERDNKWLATEVMEWDRWATDEECIIIRNDWNPFHNIGQCFEYLVPVMNKEGFFLRLRQIDEKYEAQWYSSGKPMVYVFAVADTPEAAICLAVRRAWEGK